MGLSGGAIELSMRIALLSDETERYARARGPRAAVEMARRRAGQAYDPALVEVFAATGEDLLSELDGPDCWTEVLRSEPGRARELTGEAVARALIALAH